MRAAQQRLQLQLVQSGFESLDLAAHFRGKRVVAFGELEHAGQIGARFDDVLQRASERLERLELADDLAGPLLVIPEIGLPHPSFNVGNLLQFAVVVKDCP